jgi:hypothetical protein
MLLWVDGTPAFNTPEGIAVIDQVMSCEIPEDEQQKSYVQTYQRHQHTDTCHKGNRPDCRFAYPRLVSENTHLVESGTLECIRNGGRICILKRRQNEIFINNYNMKILESWQANMDIQVRYFTKSINIYLSFFSVLSDLRKQRRYCSIHCKILHQE